MLGVCGGVVGQEACVHWTKFLKKTKVRLPPQVSSFVEFLCSYMASVGLQKLVLKVQILSLAFVHIM